jgi:hypothetical protein
VVNRSIGVREEEIRILRALRNGRWPRPAPPGMMGLYELETRSERSQMSRYSRDRNQKQRDRSPSRSYWSSSSISIELRPPRRATLAAAFRGCRPLRRAPDNNTRPIRMQAMCLKANLKGLGQESEISLLQWQQQG